jgi:hypothetical protein
MTCARQRTHTNSRPDAGIENPRQCRCNIDRADEACNTWRTLVPRRTRVGFDTGMNLAVWAGVGPVCSAVGKPSSTASRPLRHPRLKRAAPGASALALRAPSDAPDNPPIGTSASRRNPVLKNKSLAFLIDAAVWCRFLTAVHTGFGLVRSVWF